MVIKNLASIIAACLLMHQTAGMHTQTSWPQNLYTFIKKPQTLFATCIAGIGIYGCYNPAKSIEAFHWVEKTWYSKHHIISGITFALSSMLICYTWYENKHKKLPQRPLENYENSHKVLPLPPLENAELKNYIDSFAFRLTNLESILEINILEKRDKNPNLIDVIVNTLTELSQRIRQLAEQQDLLAHEVGGIKDLLYEPINNDDSENDNTVPAERPLTEKKGIKIT